MSPLRLEPTTKKVGTTPRFCQAIGPLVIFVLLLTRPKQGGFKCLKMLKSSIDAEFVTRSAKMYQEYMKQIPIPPQRASVIPFTSWTDLARTMKRMYQQPLHYLTNIRLKEMDRLRSGAAAKDAAPLDTIIHPLKAETNIWLMEEVHRLTSSHQFIAKLWIADPMYQTCIDSVFPQL